MTILLIALLLVSGSGIVQAAFGESEQRRNVPFDEIAAQAPAECSSQCLSFCKDAWDEVAAEFAATWLTANYFFVIQNDKKELMYLLSLSPDESDAWVRFVQLTVEGEGKSVTGLKSEGYVAKRIAIVPAEMFADSKTIEVFRKLPPTTE